MPSTEREEAGMSTEPIERTLDEQKQAAAEMAVEECVSDGMLVGLGTGSTAACAVRSIGERLGDGRLRGVRGVATSRQTEELAAQAGVPLEEDGEPDVVIDGADEISPSLDLIKGLGGALLREKIIADSARQQPALIIVADDSKLVDALGDGPLPVEVEPFGWRATLRALQSLGCEATPRTGEDERPLHTDGGHLTMDCRFGHITDPASLDARIKRIPGAIDTGLFVGMTRAVYVADRSSLRILTPIHSP